jgi:hypothetical protein
MKAPFFLMALWFARDWTWWTSVWCLRKEKWWGHTKDWPNYSKDNITLFFICVLISSFLRSLLFQKGPKETKTWAKKQAIICCCFIALQVLSFLVLQQKNTTQQLCPRKTSQSGFLLSHTNVEFLIFNRALVILVDLFN